MTSSSSGAHEVWQIERGVTCVVAPCCAFTFDKDHTDVADGGYSCPACEALDLRKGIERLHFATAGTSSAGSGLPASDCGGCSHAWPCPTIRLLASADEGTSR